MARQCQKVLTSRRMNCGQIHAVGTYDGFQETMTGSGTVTIPAWSPPPSLCLPDIPDDLLQGWSLSVHEKACSENLSRRPHAEDN